MIERPIIFSSEMVKAILEGRKTMTRRVIKPQPWLGAEYAQLNVFGRCIFYGNEEGILKVMAGWVCPYGQVSDRLWVRETYVFEAPDGMPEEERDCTPRYKADGLDISGWLDVASGEIGGKWCPSIFMPRWASRILLEITGIRVERLKEITVSDIEAEGHQPFVYPDGRQELSSGEAYSWFQHLWDSLNAKRGYGWGSNPFVWVISFKKLK